MKLPHAAEAIVPRNKVENYLLHLGHPIGGSKARFFIRFGFWRESWPELADALKQHALDNSVAACSGDTEGTTYLLGGRPAEYTVRPDANRAFGSAPRSLEAGELAPRLIGAYPLDT